ncbi:hypothetical protein AB0I22_04755 [Streptomyces sp. NPDC050610]|uniref:hypothetical protein n=1 Tax=Streptomyces sp. NPDC050610 TaxID=3157097 RepID=UPI00342CDB35
MRDVLDSGPVLDPRRYVSRGRETAAAEVARLLRLFASPAPAPAASQPGPVLA